MLRWIVGTNRKFDRKVSDSSTDSEEDPGEEPAENEDDDFGEKLQTETWVEWIVRATGLAELHASKAGVTDWIQAQRSRKWRFAGHVARRTDNRWSTKLLMWIPDAGKRGVGRPKTRWSDCLQDYVKAAYQDDAAIWTDIAQDRDTWHHLAEDFISNSWNY